MTWRVNEEKSRIEISFDSRLQPIIISSSDKESIKEIGLPFWDALPNLNLVSRNQILWKLDWNIPDVYFWLAINWNRWFLRFNQHCCFLCFIKEQKNSWHTNKNPIGRLKGMNCWFHWIWNMLILFIENIILKSILVRNCDLINLKIQEIERKRTWDREIRKIISQVCDR